MLQNISRGALISRAGTFYPLSNVLRLHGSCHYRSIATYLHSGSRVRGLKKNSDEYLTVQHNDKKLHIDRVDLSAYKSEIFDKLNMNKYGIDLDESLVLQCLTHKSFAHGLKPYNEKLSVMGYHFIKYFAIVKDMTKLQNSENVNNKNIIGSAFSKKVLSNEVLNKVFEQHQLQDLVFWKKRALDHNEGNFNGEFTVHSTCLKALVGAILLKNGQDKTSQFFEQEIYHKMVQLASKQ
ncbi:hypothetical protein ACO0RG_002393 [Hanseniaspora osmophila]|uniref:54S ribosomal protein L15, mitochondrial n=1 Tax=Hanseniaspora osmophila TaxID=56408 RepID=A0A1E5RVW9_9ASCO|nr:54S ribosomal protein L15, mitochondrial [Hanseniaspora osmophila]